MSSKWYLLVKGPSLTATLPVAALKDDWIAVTRVNTQVINHQLFLTSVRKHLPHTNTTNDKLCI